MKIKLLPCVSIFLLFFSLTSQAGLLTVIGKGVSELWDEVTSSSSKSFFDTTSFIPKSEAPKKTFDEIIGNSAETYSIEPLSNNHFEIHWSFQSRSEFLRALDKHCMRYDIREKIENSVEEYKKLVAQVNSGNDSNYLGAKIFVYVLNKQVIPSTGIDYISVEFTENFAFKDISFELVSMCGYSIKYAASSDNVTISGARIDGSETVKLLKQPLTVQ